MSNERIKFIKADLFEEPTTLSNVVGYLSSYMNVRNAELSDTSRVVLWSKFVTCDYNDMKHEVGQGDAILLLGIEGAVQVHRLATDGKLNLIFSCAIGRIDAATILCSPINVSDDPFVKERPILCAVFECRCSFISMRSGRCVKEVMCKSELVDVCATARVIIASSRTDLVLLCARQLVVLITLTNCRPSTYPYVPVAHALTNHWLAYAEHTINPFMTSVGGDLSDSFDKPYVLSLIDIKKRMTPSSMVCEDGDNEIGDEIGVVSIVHIDAVLDQVGKGGSLLVDGHMPAHVLIAHFTAHKWTPVTRMIFDSTGTLLLTTCEQGIFCHLFRVVPHPTSCNQAAVLHLYRLYRGETPRHVVSMAISRDSRLAAAVSDHGTVHIWPISSYGGPLCVRTHCQGHVVNRLSRLERSAGMQEYQVTRPHTISVSSDVTGQPNHSLHLICPRLPPLPVPCTLHSYAQLKPLSSLPITNRPLPLTPWFSLADSANTCSNSFTRTEFVLILTPDFRLLQYALNIHPDPVGQPIPARTELDGPFIIDKRPNLQWRIPSLVTDCLDRTPLPNLSLHQSRLVQTLSYRRETQPAMLQSVIHGDFSEFPDQFQEECIVTPQCWFSNIEINSQISTTSSIRRQEKFSISTYQSKEPSDVRLEVLQKSPSISSQLSNISWHAEDRAKEENSSQPVRVPHSDLRIQICNSFCGSSISDSLPGSTDNVIFALAHAIHDEDGTEEQSIDNWDEPKSSYIEFMTRDISHVRLRRVSGSFSSDISRLPFATSPTHEDIPEEWHYQEEPTNSIVNKQGKRQENKKKTRKS